MGRPELDPVLNQRIIDLIRAGNYLEVAATAAGIHRTTLHRWLRHGRDQVRGKYRMMVKVPVVAPAVMFSVEPLPAETEAGLTETVGPAGETVAARLRAQC